MKAKKKAKKAKEVKCCHTLRARKFHCICGEENDWLPGAETQACTECQRVHAKGKGMKVNTRPCEGTGKKVKFSEAVWRAHDEFLREMFRCGYLTSRNGLVNFTNHNAAKRSRYEGFTVKVTAHFGGKGDL
jgi:ribosomal protein L28